MKNQVLLFGLLFVTIVTEVNSLLFQIASPSREKSQALNSTLTHGWKFGRDFEIKIPFIKDGPSLSVDINAKAKGGNTDELQKSLTQSMTNIRNAINEFTGNIILQTTAAVRDAFDISDKAFKEFVSIIPGIRLLFDANGDNKPTERKNLLPSLKIPKLPGFMNLPSLLSKFNTTRVKNLFEIPDTTALENEKLSKDSINVSFEALGKNVNQAISVATQKITGIFNSFKNYTSNLLKEISTISGAAEVELNSTVNNLNDDLKECVDEYGNPIEDGIEAAVNSAQECVYNKANEAKEIVEKTLSDINAARVSLANLGSKLSNCQLNISLTVGSLPLIGTSQSACFASALYSIQAEALTLPVGIAARATEVGSIFVSSKGYLMQCVAHFVEDISKQTTNTTLAVAKCMSEKQEKQQS